MRDSYGVKIEENDIVLSVATVSGNVKVGRIVKGRTGNLSLEHHTEVGWYWSKRKWNGETRNYEDNPKPIRTQLGSTNIVIRKADGTLTATLEGILALSNEHERAETDDDQTEEPMEHGDIHPGTA